MKFILNQNNTVFVIFTESIIRKGREAPY